MACDKPPWRTTKDLIILALTGHQHDVRCTTRAFFTWRVARASAIARLSSPGLHTIKVIPPFIRATIRFQKKGTTIESRT